MKLSKSPTINTHTPAEIQIE